MIPFASLQTDLTLPDPDSAGPDKADMIRIMNEVVGFNFERKREMKKKRGEYNNYSSEVLQSCNSKEPCHIVFLKIYH